MAKTVASIIDGIIAREGDAYTNDPADSGGPTKYGITLATLTAAREQPCTAGDVESLTRAEAFETYRSMYVYDPGFYLLLGHSPEIAAEVIDSGVNLGQGRAGRWLQRSLNVLNNRGKHYGDIDVDGAVGPATEGAFAAYLALRGDAGEQVLLEMLNALQGAFYVELAERREKDERFVYGWFSHRVGTA